MPFINEHHFAASGGWVSGLWRDGWERDPPIAHSIYVVDKLSRQHGIAFHLDRSDGGKDVPIEFATSSQEFGRIGRQDFGEQK